MPVMSAVFWGVMMVGSDLGVLDKVSVGLAQAFSQTDLGLPAQGVEAAAVHPLARGTVGFAGVKSDAATVAHGLADGVSELIDGDVAAEAGIDVALHRQGMGL